MKTRKNNILKLTLLCSLLTSTCSYHQRTNACFISTCAKLFIGATITAAAVIAAYFYIQENGGINGTPRRRRNRPPRIVDQVQEVIQDGVDVINETVDAVEKKLNKRNNSPLDNIKKKLFRKKKGIKIEINV